MPSSIVVDASALVELLVRGPRASALEEAIGDGESIAPDVIYPEVLQSLRGLERGGALTAERASLAARRLAGSPIGRVPTRALLQDAWSLRHNLSAYDACYIALARSLSCPLLTADARLAGAPRLGVALIVV